MRACLVRSKPSCCVMSCCCSSPRQRHARNRASMWWHPSCPGVWLRVLPIPLYTQVKRQASMHAQFAASGSLPQGPQTMPWPAAAAAAVPPVPTPAACHHLRPSDLPCSDLRCTKTAAGQGSAPAHTAASPSTPQSVTVSATHCVWNHCVLAQHVVYSAECGRACAHCWQRVHACWLCL
jgi:hypothetical protein